MTPLRRILKEIHRRSLWQLLGSYAVGAWIVLQLAEVLASLIGLPLWFGPVVLALLGVGLGLILLTALIQGGMRSRPVVQVRRGWLGRTFTWRNALVGAALVGGLLIVGTAGYMGLRAAGIGPAGTLLARGVLDDSDRIILAELENRTTDPDLAGTVTALLRIDLAQSPTITLLEPVQLEPVLRRMQREPGEPLTFDVAREIAQREGLKAIIAGEVLPLGDGYVISARLVATATGESLATARSAAAGVDGIPAAVDEVSASLRERIGDSLRTIRAEPALAQVTTSSIDALRAYVRAEQRDNAGDVDGALALLESAVEHDSTFAMAYRKLAVVLNNAGRDGRRAAEAATRAFELRNRLSDRERHLAEAAYHSSVRFDDQAAIESYETLLAKYPNEGIGLNNLASLYMSQGRLGDAEPLLRRRLELGDAASATWMNMITVQFDLGRTDSARAVLESFEATRPGTPIGAFLASRIESASFDHSAAETVIRTLVVQSAGSGAVVAQARMELVNVLLVQGRLEEALAEYRLAFMAGAPGSPADRAAQWAIKETILRAYGDLDFSEDPEAARRRLDGIAAGELELLDPADREYLLRASIRAAAGEPAVASDILREYELNVPAPDRASASARIAETIVHGAIAEARGLDREARTYYHEAVVTPVCSICGLAELAGFHDRAGQADSAIAGYERYLSTPELDRVTQDNVRLWRVLWRLGALHEAEGDARRAIEYSTRLLDLLANADAVLQPRVREARDRIARLVGPG